MEDEIIRTMQSHPAGSIQMYILGIAALILFPWLSYLSIALGILIIATTELIRRSETFFITDTGIAREFTLLSKTRTFVEYAQIENLNVEQTLFDRIFGIGTIFIDTAGSDAVELKLHDIPNPQEVELLIRHREERVEERRDGGSGSPAGPPATTTDAK